MCLQCLNLLFAQCSPIALGKIGFNYFYFFFVFNLISGICYIFFYPETKGRTLEQMDEIFGDAKVAHVLGSPEAALAERKHEKLGASGEHNEIAESV